MKGLSNPLAVLIHGFHGVFCIAPIQVLLAHFIMPWMCLRALCHAWISNQTATVTYGGNEILK